MFKTLNARLLGVLVCFAIAMAILFLVVMRHLDTARNQELHQKLYRTLASQLVSENILPASEDTDSEQIQRVFDRSYRAEKSRGEFSGHAGLGLAIAKRILDLHHSTVTAQSRPDDTSIAFPLAYANVGNPAAAPSSNATTV